MPYSANIGISCACLLLSLPATGQYHPRDVSTKGTLILFIPTKDGLVVAADSRSNVDLGAVNAGYCDTATKIVPLKNHNRAVIAVAGTDKSYPAHGDKLADSCAYIQSALPIFNMSKTVSDYLEATNVEITKAVFDELEAHVLREIRKVQAKRPNTLFNSEDGKFAVVALGRYIPEQKVSIVATFTVRILERGSATIIARTWDAYQMSSNWEVRGVGDGTNLLQQLFSEQSPGILAKYIRDLLTTSMSSLRSGPFGATRAQKLPLT